MASPPPPPPPPPAQPPGLRQFPCKQCGANLQFEPGQVALVCPYCKAENQIAVTRDGVEELDFHAVLAQLQAGAAVHEIVVVKCAGCAAESTLAANVTADRCPFCSSPIVAQKQSVKAIRPRSLLPFHIRQEQAADSFARWIASLWFAPSELKKFAEAGSLKGVYLPYWTYDCDAQTWYTGQRGDDYQDTETYTTTENGQTVTRTRTVTKTRWWPVSGEVFNRFDDVLVIASNSLPAKYIQKLEPWDLQNLVGYGDEFLAGFVAESYQVDLPQGFEVAKVIMDPVIRQTICRDIGGDHQQISSARTQYHAITFKHILLPLWISAYRYRGRVFRFMVNARTGEVTGERPWSAWKITLLVLFIVAVIGIIALIAANR